LLLLWKHWPRNFIGPTTNLRIRHGAQCILSTLVVLAMLIRLTSLMNPARTEACRWAGHYANHCPLSTSFPGEPMLFCSWRLSRLQFFSLFENSQSISTLYQDTPCYFCKFPLCLYVQKCVQLLLLTSCSAEKLPCRGMTSRLLLHVDTIVGLTCYWPRKLPQGARVQRYWRKICSNFELLI